MNILKHRFVSAKSNGPDATQVQPTNWNDGHAFTGGAAGEILTRDLTDVDYGAKWAALPAIPPGLPPGGALNELLARDATVPTYASKWVPAPTGGGGAGVNVITITTQTQLAIPTGPTAHFVMFTGSAPLAFDGLTPLSGSFTPGTFVEMMNMSTGAAVVTLTHQAAAAPTGKFTNVLNGPTATRIRAQGATNTGGFVRYIWDGSQWRLVGHEQGGGMSLGLTNANFTGFTCSNIVVQDFYARGRDNHIRIYLAPAVIPAPVQKLLIGGWPWTFAPTSSHYQPALTGTVAGGWVPDLLQIADAGANMALLSHLAGAPMFPAGDLYISLDVTLPCL